MTLDPEGFAPAHFHWGFEDGVATVTLNRPDRKNPLTFESYAELRDLFRQLVYTPEVKAVVIAGAGGNFRSEEHTSELQSLMRISYAVFCLKKKKQIHHQYTIV